MRWGAGVLWLVLLVSLPSVGRAATYYVQNGGPNNGCAPDSSTTRRNSISAGLQCLSAGDTLIIGNGTYSETIGAGAIPSGTPGQYTTLQAENRRGAIVQPNFSTNRLLSFGENGQNQHYIRVTGLVFDGTSIGSGAAAVVFSGQFGSGDILFDDNEVRNMVGASHALSTAFALFYTYPQSGTVIRNNYIHDIGVGDDSTFTTWSYGIYLSSSGLLFEGNEIARTSGFPIHGYSSGGDVSNNIIRNNYIHDTGAAVLVCHANNQIYNNVLERMSTGAACAGNFAQCGGILLGGSCSGVENTGSRIYNNTIVNGGANGGRGGCIQLGYADASSTVVSGAIIANNLCENNAVNQIVIDSDGGGNSFAANHCNGQSGAACIRSGNPSFTGTGSGPNAYQLSTGSVDIDAGTSVPFTTDFGGNQRAQGNAPDIGAWESGGQITPPGSDATWTFDEGANTTATDSSGNGRTITLQTPMWGQPRVGTAALACNGTNQGQTTQAFTNTKYTWMLWLNPGTAPSTTTNQIPFNNGGVTGGDGWALNWGHSNPPFRQAAQHRLADGTWVAASFPGTFTVGTWVHLAAVFNGTTLRIYRDGQPVLTVSAASSYATSGAFYVCAPNAGGSFGFTGSLDQFKVANREMTDTDIHNEYVSASPLRNVKHRRGPQ